jgi:hypothetical protein
VQRFSASQFTKDALSDPDNRKILDGDTEGWAVAGSMRALDGSPGAARKLKNRIAAANTVQCTLLISTGDKTEADGKGSTLTTMRDLLEQQLLDLTSGGRPLLEGGKPTLTFVTLGRGTDSLLGTTMASYTLTVTADSLEACALMTDSAAFLRTCSSRPFWTDSAITQWPQGSGDSAAKRLLIVDQSVPSPYTAQSRHQHDTVAQQVLTALEHLPSHVKYAPVTCYMDLVGGALGVSVVCLNLSVMAYVTLASSALGTACPVNQFASMLPIRTFHVTKDKTRSIRTEAEEAETDEPEETTWSVVAAG